MLKRILTGIFLIALGAYIIYASPKVVLFSVCAASLLVLYEMTTMYFKGRDQRMYFSLSAGVCLILFGYLSQVDILPVVSSLLFKGVSGLLLAMYLLELFAKGFFFPQAKLLRWVKMTLFVGISLPFFYFLKLLPSGAFYIAFTCVVIGFCDTMALFFGRWLGKHPLTAISPKKTIEGSLAGGFFGMVSGGLMAYLFHFPVLHFTLLSFFIFVLALLGDLHESKTKRFFGVKDSSQILPGHGGIYDRLDSYFFTFPLVFFWLS